MDIETFIERIDSYIKEYPVEAEKALRKEANRMKKEIVKESPTGKGKKRKITNSWRMAINGGSIQTLEATLRNTSPHFHLVERGHVQKNAHGKVTGFTQGKFFFKKTVEKNKGDVKEAVGGYMYKMLRKKIKDG